MARKRLIWIVLLVLLLVVSGGGYYYYNQVYLQAQEPVEEETIATYTVGRGDLVITASGSGTLIPAAEMAVDSIRTAGGAQQVELYALQDWSPPPSGGLTHPAP